MCVEVVRALRKLPCFLVMLDTPPFSKPDVLRPDVRPLKRKCTPTLRPHQACAEVLFTLPKTRNDANTHPRANDESGYIRPMKSQSMMNGGDAQNKVDNPPRRPVGERTPTPKGEHGPLPLAPGSRTGQSVHRDRNPHSCGHGERDGRSDR